jgi:hypothetical protein
VPVELPPDPVTRERRRRWLYGDTRRAVQEEQTKLLRELATGSYLEPATLTVAEYLDRWLADVMQPGRAITTWETAASHVRTWLTPHLSSLKLRGLQPGHIAALLAQIVCLASREIGHPTGCTTRLAARHPGGGMVC